jgi:hypothetical protein
MIPNIKFKKFQISLIMELFMCLMLELLKLLLKFYSLGIFFFFEICDLKIFANFFNIFFL